MLYKKKRKAAFAREHDIERSRKGERTLLLGVSLCSALGPWIESLRQRRTCWCTCCRRYARISRTSEWKLHSTGKCQGMSACDPRAARCIERPALFRRPHETYWERDEIANLMPSSRETNRLSFFVFTTIIFILLT